MRALASLALLLAACAPEKPIDSGEPAVAPDADGDGYGGDADCDDASAAIHPGAVEACDGLDGDCDGAIDEDAGDATTFYVDGDADGFGDDARTVRSCSAPAGTATEGGDCDDGDPAFHPGADEADCTDPADYNCDGSVGYADADGDGWAACAECDDLSADVRPDATEACNTRDDDCDGATDEAGATGEATWYADADGDGHGDVGRPAVACDAPLDHVATADDCDDAEPRIHPGADEADCTDPVDYNCDGSTGFVDADGDGVAACAECDDADATVFPGAPESCDGTDEDCDGATDEAGSDGESTWYADADGDGFGDAATPTVACGASPGWVADATDCDDADAAVSPGGTEVCDAANTDEDCDGAADDADATVSTATRSTFHRDADGDTYGAAAGTTSACDAPSGYVVDGTDCDDAAAAVSPAATEVCDAADRDEDCDDAADDADASVSAATRTPFYRDADGDGYGAAATAVSECDAPAGYIPTAGDCDDADGSVKPGATETCDGEDDDCDGLVDGDDPGAVTTTWYADADGDGYGDPASPYGTCEEPVGSVTDATDCDDSDADVNLDGTELYGDATDDDCDGATTPPDYDSCAGFDVPGDYATLAAALAALENSTATICLGEGDHLGSFTFDGTGNVTVQGRGRGRTRLVSGPTIEPHGGSFTLQGMSIAGLVTVTDSVTGTTDNQQRVYLTDLEIDSTGHGVWIVRYDWSNIWVWMDGVDIDAGSGSSYAGVAIQDADAWLYGDFQVVMYNLYVHDSATCVRADMDQDETSFLYLEDSTLYNCGTGVLLDSPTSAADANFSVNNNVIYGMTTVAINDNSDRYGEITGSYNALYGNASNYAGSATAGTGYLTSDPMLDFSYSPPRPREGSPLVDAGGMWLGPTADYWGTGRSWPPDIGAIER